MIQQSVKVECPTLDTDTGIQFLPSEVLLLIFSFFASASGAREELYAARSVCRLWRALINSTPEFWVKFQQCLCLYINYPPEVTHATLSHFLARIDQLHIHVPWLPINLLVSVKDAASIVMFQPALNAIANEIISINFEFKTKGDSPDFPFAMLPLMPKLKNCRVSIQAGQPLCLLSGRTPSHILNLCSSPELTSFSSERAYALGHLLSIYTVCEWTRLTRLALCEAEISMETIYKIIIQCSNLTYAQLRINAPDPGVLGRITHHHRLKYLAMLRLNTYGPYYHRFLDTLILPALEDLTLQEHNQKPSESGLLFSTLASLHKRSSFPLVCIMFSLGSVDPVAFAEFLCSTPTLEVVKLQAPEGLNTESLILLANPTVLLRLQHFFCMQKYDRLSQLRVDVSENALLTFLQVRARVPALECIRLNLIGSVADSIPVRSLVELLRRERPGIILKV